MSELDDAIEAISLAIGEVETAEYRGDAYININIISAINDGIANAFNSKAHPQMADVPEDFLRGMYLVMSMYHRIYVGVLDRHAADMVPDFVPDGMDE